MAILKTEQNLIEALRELCFESGDFHPLGGGIIYKTQDYFDAKKHNLPTKGIRITNMSTGKVCGFIYENKPTEIEWFDKEKEEFEFL